MRKKFGGYTVAGEPQEEKKYRGTQLVMALLLGCLFLGPLSARIFGWHMSVAWLGVSVTAGVLLLLALFVWALRHWDY